MKKILGIIAVIIVIGLGVWLILSRGQKHVEPTISEITETIVAGEPIKIRGTFNAAGVDAKNGAELAIKEINDNGGVNGQPLVFASENADGSLTNYLATPIKGVDLTLYTDTDIEAIIAAGRVKATTFSTAPRVQPRAIKALEYFSKNNLKTVTVGSGSKALVQAFKDEAPRYKVEIVENGKANALFMDAPTISNDQTTYYVATPKPLDQKFADMYKLLYKKDATSAAGSAYDAVYMMARAVKDQPTDLARYMRGVNFKTVGFGNVTFDEMGGITTPENYYILQQVKGSKIVEVR